MIAASRFSGGPVVQTGFVLCFVGVAVALAVVTLVPGHHASAPRRIAWTAAALAMGSIVALWLPAYEGVTSAEKLVVESGWSGLDPVSLFGTALMDAVIVVAAITPRGGADLAAGAATSAACLLGGNWLIQWDTTQGTSIRYGLGVTTVLSLSALAVAAVGVRGGDS